MAIETATLDTWDIVTIVVYFAIVMMVGIIVSTTAIVVFVHSIRFNTSAHPIIRFTQVLKNKNKK